MKNKRLGFLKLALFLGFFTFLVFGIKTANAASLYFSPSSGSYSVDNILSTSVLVNTQGTAINSSNAIINFPTDLLEVISVNQSGSIFSIWVEGPSFSNSAGTISFTAGLPTPGFTGTTGKIINITFKARKAGTATLIFSSANVRADDGFGTNVLTSIGQAQFNLIREEEPPVVPPPVVPPPTETPPSVENTPKAPKISSPTHPNSEQWYSNNDPEFTWGVPSGITGARLLLDDLPTSAPNVFYSGAVSEKQLEDLDDGVWYFHVQLRNRYGWGGTSHFKVQIDTEAPQSFEIIVKEGEETTNPQPTLLFETSGEESEINHYEVKIDSEPSIIIKENEYKMPVQSLGKHTIIVKAVDRAGNATLAIKEINILSIEAPVITDYPQELLPKSILIIKGTVLPEVTVKLYIQKNKNEIKIKETKSDKEGNWIYIEVDPVEEGIYQVWAEAVDSSGSKSLPSNKVTILVNPPDFLTIGKLAINYLTTIMTLLILVLAIIFVIFWFWLWIRKKKKSIQNEVEEAEKALYQAFKILRKETKEQVAKLDGKPGLSAKEKKICTSLKKALNSSEKIIGQKIKDVGNKINKNKIK
jgi:cohesin domain-containing protein